MRARCLDSGTDQTTDRPEFAQNVIQDDYALDNMKIQQKNAKKHNLSNW